MKINELPIWPRILAAKPHDSEAKTPRGILRAVIADCRKKSRFSRLFMPGPDFLGFIKSDGRPLSRLSVIDEPSEVIRKRSWARGPIRRRVFSDEERETRRAIADKKFRRNWLARIRREVVRLTTPPDRDAPLLEIAEWEMRKQEAASRRFNLAAMVKRVSPRVRLPEFPKVPWRTVEITYPETACELGFKVQMRVADACILSTYKPSYLHYEPGETKWRNGRPEKYTRAVYNNYVRSFAVVRSDGRLSVLAHEREFDVLAPEGHHWDVDRHGVRLVLGGAEDADFHPALEQLLFQLEAPSGIPTLIQRNLERRERMKAEAAALKAEAEGVWVCAVDSLRAGNCRVGTESFARRHGLEPNRHYPAARLLEMTTDDHHRLRGAIVSAIRRHRQEVKRGFAYISQHRLTA